MPFSTLSLTNKQVEEAGNAGCGNDTERRDMMNAIFNRNVAATFNSMGKTFGMNFFKLLAETAVGIGSSQIEAESVATYKYYTEFQKSISDIHKFKAMVISNLREIFSQLDQNNDSYSNTDTAFMRSIVIPYIERDNAIITDKANNFLTSIENNLNTLYDIYDSNRKNMSILNNILEMKEKKLFDTIANIQLYEQKNNVDVRNNLYQFERIELYDNIFNTLKIIYFLLLLAYIIFGNFMKEEMYKKKYFYMVAIIYISLPFILKYIFAGIIFLYEYIQNLLGIKKQVLTYDDIVRANNIDNIYTNPVPDIRDRMDVIQAYRTFVQNPRNQNLPFVNRSVESLT